MVSLSDQKLQRKTESLNFPEYQSIKKADSLARILREEIPKDLDEEQKSKLFAIPRSFLGDDINSSLFSASALLNIMLISAKDLYRKNKINFEESDFLNDDTLCETIPNLDVLGFKNLDSDSNLEELCLGFATQLVEGVENEFYFLNIYDSRKTGPEMEKRIEKHVKNIGKYSQLGIKASEIIKGMNMHAEGGAMEGVMKSLANSGKLTDMIRREDQNIYFSQVLKLHAQLKGSTFDGNSWAFSDQLGHEISTNMDLARDIDLTFHVLSDLDLSGEDDQVVPFKGYLHFPSYGEILRESWKEDWEKTISESLMSDEDMAFRLGLLNSPFCDLEGRLHSLGIPSKLAHNVSEYLSFNHIWRLSSKVLEGTELVASDIPKELYSRGENFAAALSQFMQGVTGKEPNQFSYKFFQESEDVKTADAIASVSNVTSLDSEGEIETFYEGFSKLESERESERVSSLFGKETDSYVGVNQGVCFIFNVDPTGSVFNPKISVIENRESYNGAGNRSSLDNRLVNLTTDFHETVHATQVGSRLAWREMASFVTQYFCDLTIKQLQLGRLDLEVPNQKMKKLVTEGRTWREVILEMQHQYAAQALGKNELAERMREKGLYHALFEAEVPLNDDGFVGVKTLKEISPMEKSLTASHIKKFNRLLKNSSDLEDFENFERDIKNHSTELLGIMETMADSFSLVAAEKFLDNLPDKRYGPRAKEAYFESLYSSLCRRGEFSNKFLEITTRFPNLNERNIELAKYGLRYQQDICKERDQIPISRRLVSMGYNPIDPYEAYEDIEMLRSVQNNLREDFGNVLYPINSALAKIGLRYNANIPQFTKFIRKHGNEEAFEKILNAEKFSQIK